MESLVPEMIATEFNEGPFKLICDDLGLANMIAKSSEDLTIVEIRSGMGICGISTAILLGTMVATLRWTD